MEKLKKVTAVAAALGAAVLFFGFTVFATLSTRSHADLTPRGEAIVALTGGAHRIGEAGRLLRGKSGRRLLITGVNRVVSKSALRKLLGVESDLFACCVDIDYAAQNTRGNAVATHKWAERHGFKSIIVVTASYHMPRSMTELGRLLPAVDLIAHPVLPERFRTHPWWLDAENVQLLAAEYLKYLPSAAHYGLDRLIDAPAREKDEAAVQKAVAIQ